MNSDNQAPDQNHPVEEPVTYNLQNPLDPTIPQPQVIVTTEPATNTNIQTVANTTNVPQSPTDPQVAVTPMPPNGPKSSKSKIKLIRFILLLVGLVVITGVVVLLLLSGNKKSDNSHSVANKENTSQTQNKIKPGIHSGPGVNTDTNNKSTAKPTSSSPASDHVEGLGQDHVTLVEYGDYQCPYCGQYYPIVKQVAAQYNQQITFQFRNYPLAELHPNALAAAQAAEAAGLQNQFCQMHDLLYQQDEDYFSDESTNNWVNASNPLSDFDTMAQQLGLNVSEFNSDYSSTAVSNTIQADIDAGNALGIDATPTFLINGKQVSIGESVADFDSAINSALSNQ